jgi:small subunit ribosomal protein S17
MAEETENTETTEDTAPVEETPAAEAPEATEAAPAEEAPAAAEAPAAEAAPEPEPAPAAEPEVLLSPKERRAKRRGEAVAKRGPRRARPEEREADRARKAAERRRYRAKQKEKRAAQPKAETPVVEDSHAHEKTGHQKVRSGVVVSDKADKTITVRIDVTRHHRRYKKTIRSSSTIHAHDETNDAKAGDTVRVVEARPLSRTKRWRLVEVLERAK